MYILKDIELCPFCKKLIIPALGCWWHPDAECHLNDGLLVMQDDDEIVIRIDSAIQEKFIEVYRKRDILRKI